MSDAETLTENVWVQTNLKIKSESIDDPRSWKLMQEIVYRSRRDFEEVISNSEWILENFVSFPEGAQETLVDLVGRSLAVKEIEAYLKTLLRLQAHFDENRIMIDALDLSMDRLWGNIDNTPEPMSKQNRDHIESIFPMSQASLVYRNAFYMLRILHGEQKAFFVFSEWAKTGEKVQLSILIPILERWDEFKELPITWSINLINDV